jgi:hypothetical protein
MITSSQVWYMTLWGSRTLEKFHWFNLRMWFLSTNTRCARWNKKCRRLGTHLLKRPSSTICTRWYICAWMFGRPIPCKNEHCSKNLSEICFVKGAISCRKCSCQVVLYGHPWPKNAISLQNIKINGEGGRTSASRTLLCIPKVPSNMWSCPWPKFPTSIALWHELEAKNVNWKNPNVGVCLC